MKVVFSGILEVVFFVAENNELKDTKNAAIFFPSFPPFVPSYLLVPHLGISPLVGSLSAASLPEVNKAVCIITSSQSDRWAGVCLVCANVTLEWRVVRSII